MWVKSRNISVLEPFQRFLKLDVPVLSFCNDLSHLLYIIIVLIMLPSVYDPQKVNRQGR